MKVHKSTIENYSFERLAEEIGDLKYNALAEFLKILSNKIYNDGRKDELRGRIKLATQLKRAASDLDSCSKNIDAAWTICKPFTD
jgi:hypothetical protein